ncbi:MAG: T9SS type A sorting domain-containing protein [Bacteroidota bacterium]
MKNDLFTPLKLKISMFKKKTIIFSIVFLLTISTSFCQSHKKVLFLGNSYTYVNNLPQLVRDVAFSAGDTVIFDSNSPGGYTLQGHSSDTTTISKIISGGWDFVVLQEQSQMPSFPLSQVQTDVFPFAYLLDSLINANNPCAETVFYMTWGRKNGDASNCASWPPVCTYQGMDSLLKLRYCMMANDNHAILSPVGAVFHYIRDNYPSIELYQADESHPSAAGSFAAACCFYTSLFRKNPSLISYSYSMDSTIISQIIQSVKLVVFDSLLNWNIGLFDLKAQFDFTAMEQNVQFNNFSVSAESYYWDFGDGTNSTQNNPIHYYVNSGTYSVLLKVYHCNQMDSIRQNLIVIPEFVDNEKGNVKFNLFPNPVKDKLTLCAQNMFCPKTKVIIWDVSGRKVFEQMVSGYQTNVDFDLSGLYNGIYYISVWDNNQLCLTNKKLVLIK